VWLKCIKRSTQHAVALTYTYSIILLYIYYYYFKPQVVGSVGAGTPENHKPAARKARKTSNVREERFIQ